MIFAGVGAREAPQVVRNAMCKASFFLTGLGYTVVTGGARGIDTSFMEGVCYPDKLIVYTANDATPEAIEHASQFHPAWDKCSEYERKLHGRNSMVLLSPTLSNPVEFVLCYTQCGQIVGGTGQSIRVANAYGIPVNNIGKPRALDKFLGYLQRIEDEFYATLS